MSASSTRPPCRTRWLERARSEDDSVRSNAQTSLEMRRLDSLGPDIRRPRYRSAVGSKYDEVWRSRWTSARSSSQPQVYFEREAKEML